MRFSSIVLATVLLAAAPAAPAWAQDASASVKDKSKAIFRFEEGKRALARGDVDAAIPALEEAHRVLGTAATGVTLAKALAKKGRLVEAAKLAQAAAAKKASPGDTFAISQARAEAEKLAPALEARIPGLRVVVIGADDAKVTIDGADVPAAADGVRRVDPGERVVVATSGERRVEAKVKLAEGQNEELKLPLPGATGAATAVTKGPASGPAAPAAARPSRAGSEGGSTSTAIAIGAFGAGALGVGVGLGTLFESMGRKGDVDDACADGCAASLEREATQNDELSLVSTVGLIGGGALMATGIIFAIVGSGSGDEAASTAPRTRVVLAPGYVGLSGAF